jgi:hypothetical protein
MLIDVVIPVETGIQDFQEFCTPAFAGVTIWMYLLILQLITG